MTPTKSLWAKLEKAGFDPNQLSKSWREGERGYKTRAIDKSLRGSVYVDSDHVCIQDKKLAEIIEKNLLSTGIKRDEKSRNYPEWFSDKIVDVVVDEIVKVVDEMKKKMIGKKF